MNTIPDTLGRNFLRGEKFFELSNQLGNVLAVVSDRKLQVSAGAAHYFTADLQRVRDYYAFGMAMPGRTFSLGREYRYGFNGMENDNEINGYGNSSDFGARIYDSRIGRWLSRDPMEIKYSFASPYNYTLNNPVRFTDPDGKMVGGYTTTPLSTFLQALTIWDVEASKKEYRITKQLNEFRPGMGGPTYGNENQAKLRIMAHDITASNQIINAVGSYSSAFGSFIDVGLPLDLKHFMNYAKLSFILPNFAVKAFSTHREYRQSLDPRESGFTSSFVANDIFSNYLGIYFGDDLGLEDDFVQTLTTFLEEVNTLFSTGEIENAVHLTPSRVKELKSLGKTYYGTDDLTRFQNGDEFYNKAGYTKSNLEAQERTDPFYELWLKLEWTLFPGPEPGYREEAKPGPLLHMSPPGISVPTWAIPSHQSSPEDSDE